MAEKRNQNKCISANLKQRRIGLIRYRISKRARYLFDRIFIDWFWVERTKAWVISGTEDLQPYIPRKTAIRKWVGTMIGFPVLAAIIVGIASLLLH